MKIINFLNILITLLISINFSFANTAYEGNPSIFDKLSYQEILEVDLEMNMEEVFGNRRSADKHKAIFSFKNEFGEIENWKIKVALRGKFRRSRCENLPPLKLNFSKKDLKAEGLAKYDDMKLVTHCVEDSRDAQQLLVREYLAYKLYNQITDESFRVQFLKINYRDVVTGEVEKQYGFVIEDTAELRSRINAEKVEQAFNMPAEKFNENQAKLVSLFNYMIGNPDWSIGRNHNVKVMLQNGKLVAIPYDFDFSGIVDAPYVMLNPELGIANQKERVFLGFESHVTELENEIEFLFSKKEMLIRTIKDSKLIKGKNRREMIKFINSFYDESDTINLPIVKGKVPTLGE